MRYLINLVQFSCFVFCFVGIAHSSEYATVVPMTEKGTATYFVSAKIGKNKLDLLVDTGAGYTTLNRDLLAILKRDGFAKPIGEIEGILANGDVLILPIYRVSALNLGGCVIRNFEVAETPTHARNLLGLSALKKAAPFSFSLEPAELKLSHCRLAVAVEKQPEVAVKGLVMQSELSSLE